MKILSKNRSEKTKIPSVRIRQKKDKKVEVKVKWIVKTAFPWIGKAVFVGFLFSQWKEPQDI